MLQCPLLSQLKQRLLHLCRHHLGIKWYSCSAAPHIQVFFTPAKKINGKSIVRACIEAVNIDGTYDVRLVKTKSSQRGTFFSGQYPCRIARVFRKNVTQSEVNQPSKGDVSEILTEYPAQFKIAYAGELFDSLSSLSARYPEVSALGTVTISAPHAGAVVPGCNHNFWVIYSDNGEWNGDVVISKCSSYSVASGPVECVEINADSVPIMPSSGKICPVPEPSVRRQFLPICLGIRRFAC